MTDVMRVLFLFFSIQILVPSGFSDKIGTLTPHPSLIQWVSFLQVFLVFSFTKPDF